MFLSLVMRFQDWIFRKTIESHLAGEFSTFALDKGGNNITRARVVDALFPDMDICMKCHVAFHQKDKRFSDCWYCFPTWENKTKMRSIIVNDEFLKTKAKYLHPIK